MRIRLFPRTPPPSDANERTGAWLASSGIVSHRATVAVSHAVKKLSFLDHSPNNTKS
jgi:hypothetical protein